MIVERGILIWAELEISGKKQDLSSIWKEVVIECMLCACPRAGDASLTKGGHGPYI